MKYRPRLTLALANAVFVALLLCAAAPPAAAQTERHEPFNLPAQWTAARVWSSGGRSFARVNIQFPDGCYSIASVGPVVREGNQLSVDFAVNRWTGGCTLAIVHKEYFFDLGALEPGTYTFTIRSRGTAVRSVTFDPSQVGERWEEASLERGQVGFAVWTAGGVTFTSVSLFFPDDGYRVVEWKAPERAGNDFVSRVRLERWTGRASTLERKSDTRLFVLGTLPPDETFTVSVEFSDGVRHTSAPFTPSGTARPASMNPTDDPAFFVRQHYLDFLGREPDPEGLTFWYHDIVSRCPFIPSPCMDARRVHVSAAFFLSIESQTTGFYVYRLHKAAYGTLPRFNEFTADTRRAAGGLVVGREGWQALLEENRRRLAEEFVARAEFQARYPETMTPEQYVDALDRMIAHDWGETEGGPLTATQRESLAQGLRDGAETRATVLAKLAGHQQFVDREFRKAFVLMQYFGYLRRNPFDPPDSDLAGYSYWLGKLNQFGGDFVAAEMVKAFITSDEYRKRFGQ
ncbi:MAG: DUF4214 domain-containing protein [Acidobacteria bacterium]|nr:DUF4214 domain-containing protein [Acidobacteriota bacterium]